MADRRDRLTDVTHDVVPDVVSKPNRQRALCGSLVTWFVSELPRTGDGTLPSNVWSYPVSVDRFGLVSRDTPECFASNWMGDS